MQFCHGPYLRSLSNNIKISGLGKRSERLVDFGANVELILRRLSLSVENMCNSWIVAEFFARSEHHKNEEAYKVLQVLRSISFLEIDYKTSNSLCGSQSRQRQCVIARNARMSFSCP